MEKQFVEIRTEEELNETWKDERVPNMSFCFIENSIDECVTTEGKVYASYYPLVAHKDEIKTYHDTELGTVRYELKAGIYGLHSTHKEDLNRLSEIELSKNI
jgi:hypothetical protein